MQGYQAVYRVLMLAVLGLGSLACEDRLIMPLEPPDKPALTVTPEAWTTIDGTQYYVFNGGHYPAAGVSASIWDPKTTGDIWPYGGSINAYFDYRGHGATQSTTWRLTRLSTGEAVAGRTAANYGSGSGIALSAFKKRYTGSFAIEHPYECDLELTADSEHSAWWIGIVIVDSKPYIAPGKWGQKHAYSKMPDRIRECGETNEYGGGDGDGDEGEGEEDPYPQTCTDCQQWLNFSPSGQYLYDEWECKEISWAKCEELMS